MPHVGVRLNCCSTDKRASRLARSLRRQLVLIGTLASNIVTVVADPIEPKVTPRAKALQATEIIQCPFDLGATSMSDMPYPAVGESLR